MISLGELVYMLDPLFSAKLIGDESIEQEPKQFNEKQLSPDDVESFVRNFDEFSDEEEHIAIYMNPDGSPVIFLPTDAHQDYQNSRILTLESYFEFLFWSKGLKDARYDFFITNKPDGPQRIEILGKAYFDALPPVDIDNLY